jgi:hypothetical protein
MQTNPKAVGAVLAGALFVGLARSAFRQYSQWAPLAVTFAVATFPLLSAVQLLPKMRQSYQQVVAGDEKKGEIIFNKALEETVYQMFHLYLKPVGYGLLLASLLGLPKTVEGFTKPWELPEAYSGLSGALRKLIRPAEVSFAKHYNHWVKRLTPTLQRIGSYPMMQGIDTVDNALGKAGKHLFEAGFQAVTRWMKRGGGKL